LELILANINTKKGALFEVKRVEEKVPYFEDFNPPMKIASKEWYVKNNDSFPCDLWKTLEL